MLLYRHLDTRHLSLCVHLNAQNGHLRRLVFICYCLPSRYATRHLVAPAFSVSIMDRFQMSLLHIPILYCTRARTYLRFIPLFILGSLAYYLLLRHLPFSVRKSARFPLILSCGYLCGTPSLPTLISLPLLPLIFSSLERSSRPN